MLKSITLFCLCGFATICFSEDGMENTPRPHYHWQESDPAWLEYAVRIHGHLGPMLTFGARMGMASLRAVDAKGYFDVEVTCEGPFVKPPASCFLDGIQIGTGATLGKRNLVCTESDRILVRIKNTNTGKSAVLKPTEQFMSLLPRPQPSAKEEAKTGQNSQPGDDHQFDGLARKIVTMPEKEIMTISFPGE